MSREKIMAAAISVFSKVGYYRASMDDIARTAEVAKGTLYYHFPTKLELFKCLVTEGMKYITGKIRKEFDENLPVDIQLKNAIESNVSLYIEYKELATIFFNELSNGIDADALVEINTLKNEYICFIADILRNSCSEEKKKTINFEMAAAGFLGMLDTTCKFYLKGTDKVKLEEIQEFINEVISAWLYRMF
ncbi:MAG: hypothetical protein A2Y17_01950 [Clostridiales bacterium GWF2_38_85]|nr:MAG: hypothetical protein A2Y17_01950 [Clostridiales bacterium GWF2_38_85]HBL85338.1 TetR/AcrR family transcriptional regulator [Clostridiales bacterium]